VLLDSVCSDHNLLLVCALGGLCARAQTQITRHLFVACLPQVIDDTAGSTLAAASTLTPDVRSQLNGIGANQVG